MKFIILAATVLATAFASWEPIHEKYHGPLHYPKIHKGVPVEPAAVQHAREEHLKALSHASHKHDDYDYEHHHYDQHHESGHKWHGPLHYPKIYKGVPVEPKEVQHAREAHLSALAHASHADHHYEHDHYEHDYDNHHEEEHQKKWHGPLHYPKIYKGVPVEPKEVQHAREAHLLSHASHNGHYEHHHYETPKIGHDGKPQDTHEVELAKAKHFAAFHDALAQNTHHYRKRRGASSYVHFSSKVEHEVPVHHHEEKMIMADEHQSNNHDNSHGYSIKQIHAPVYGHHQEHDQHGYSYEQIHAPIYNHHQEEEFQSYSPIYEHHYEHYIPVIGHDGTPIDTPEVQHAKQVHFAAHAAAKLNHH